MNQLTRICLRNNNNFNSLLIRQMSTSSSSYSERQAKLGRPVSPHVTIYRFPLSALTSIANRVTGVSLSVGVAGIAGLALVGGDVSAVLSGIGSVPLVGTVGKLAVSFPLIYHYLGGVRHVVWDKNPSTLTNEDVEKASLVLIGSSVVLSLGVSVLL